MGRVVHPKSPILLKRAAQRCGAREPQGLARSTMSAKPELKKTLSARRFSLGRASSSKEKGASKDQDANKADTSQSKAQSKAKSKSDVSQPKSQSKAKSKSDASKSTSPKLEVLIFELNATGNWIERHECSAGN